MNAERIVALVALGVVVLLFFSTPAGGQEITAEVRELVAATRTSWSWGVFEGSVYAANRARDVDALVTEAAAEIAWRRLIGRLTVGGAPIGDGVLVHRSGNSDFQPSRSIIGGDSGLLYVRPEIGYQVAERPIRLDLFVGALYLREQLDAYGAQGHPLGTLTSSTDPVARTLRAATETTTWWAPTLGVRGRVPLSSRVAVSATITGMPWTYVQLDERRPFRRDLQHAATYGASTGGWGIDGRGEIEVRAWRALTVSAGVDYTRLVSGTSGHNGQGPNGFHYNPVTPDCRQPLCRPVRFEFRAVRESLAPWLGLRYRW